jgi:hypothetical protein
MAMPKKWPRCYYTYIIYEDGVPRWVGAGKNARANPKRFPQLKVRVVVFIFEQESKEVAFQFEEKWIREFGRADLGEGPLLNRTYGLGSKGRSWTDEQRQSVAKATSEREWTDEQREAASKRMMGNQRLLGHHPTDETKQLMSVALTGKKHNLSDEERQRRADWAAELGRRGKGKPKKPFTEEHKANISKGRRASYARNKSQECE